MLEVCLEHFICFTVRTDIKIVVINDFSDPQYTAEYEQIRKEFPFVRFIDNPEHSGIAKSKNICLTALCRGAWPCAHVFLFDDDCWPKKSGWMGYYIETARAAGVEHLLWMIDGVEDHLHMKAKGDLVNEFTNCMGCVQFFTRHAVDVLQGFNEEFKIYGYEHAELSRRAIQAGLIGAYTGYIAPASCGDYIYTMDMNHTHLHEPIPMGHELTLTESIPFEEKMRYAEMNSKIFNSLQK
jgi:glycosyltransferase involved in cell wall biosynthesis